MLDYVHGVGLMKRLSSAAPFESEGEDLFDLLAWLLSLACDDVLRVGINADYLPQREELTYVRGRLDVKTQILQRWGRLDRLICDFEDRARDIPENQWLLRAMRAARRGVANPSIATYVRRIASTWEELCDDDHSIELPKVTLTRTNDHYRQALNLSYLLLDGVTVSNVLRPGSIGGFSFMLNMPRLFEDFVSCLMERTFVASDIRVERQAVDRSVLWNPDLHRPFGHVRPDVMLIGEGGRLRLPVDAKYKGYSGQKLQPADIYQSTIYALALARVVLPEATPTCVLLHPAPDGPPTSTQRVQVRTRDGCIAEVMAIGLPVADLLANGVDEMSMTEHLWYAGIAGLLSADRIDCDLSRKVS
jgi:5-methylcytosine-specific restriction enzyme subunit McrC